MNSFVERLADRHSVTVRQLLMAVTSSDPGFAAGLKAWYEDHYRDTRPRTDRLPSKFSHRLALELEHLTGVRGIVRCTGRGLLNFFSREGLENDGNRFCPLCIAQEGYAPLLWKLAGVECCPVHNILLSSTNECTGEKLPTNLRKRLPWVCGACGRIGLDCCPSPPGSPSPDQLWRAQQVQAFLHEMENGLIARHAFDTGIRLVLAAIGDGEPIKGARLLGIAKSTAHGWLQGKQPRLDQLLQLCTSTRVPLVDVLTGQLTSAPISPAPVVRTSVKRTRIASDERRAAMCAALNSPEYITLKNLAQSLGVTPRTLRDDDPDLAVAIAAKGRGRRTALAEKKFVEKRAQVEESARRLIERGARVTMRSLRKETGLSLGPSPRTAKLLDGVLTSAPRSPPK